MVVGDRSVLVGESPKKVAKSKVVRLACSWRQLEPLRQEMEGHLNRIGLNSNARTTKEILDKRLIDFAAELLRNRSSKRLVDLDTPGVRIRQALDTSLEHQTHATLLEIQTFPEGAFPNLRQPHGDFECREPAPVRHAGLDLD